MSDAIPILHMLSPQKHMSPFDVNMAADAGYKVIVPYINVTLEEVTGLTQDAIFSRPPDSGVRTGIFIGGKDAILALDMMDAAKKALVPPFGLSTFADPAGSFTTAAAMVACVERVLRTKFNKGWKGTRVAVFGATGVVGFASSIIAALEGAQVTLVAHRGVDRVIKSAEVSKERFGVDLIPKSGETPEQKTAIIADAEVIFAAAAAGVRVISAADKAHRQEPARRRRRQRRAAAGRRRHGAVHGRRAAAGVQCARRRSARHRRREVQDGVGAVQAHDRLRTSRCTSTSATPSSSRGPSRLDASKASSSPR